MPASLQERLVAADTNKDDYRPNDQTVFKVNEVTEVLGSLVGVTGSGKSYLIPRIVRLGGADFSEAGNISSRENRPSDPINFRGGQPIRKLLDRIERQELVQYMVHGSGAIYGTDPASYTTRYVVLPTLTTALPQLQQTGCFRQVKPIGIVVDGATWEHQRLGENRDNLPRMREALVCIAWLRARLGKIPIVENATGEEEVTAQKIVTIMRSPLQRNSFDNLERIELLLDELAEVATRHVRRLESI